MILLAEKDEIRTNSQNAGTIGNRRHAQSAVRVVENRVQHLQENITEDEQTVGRHLNADLVVLLA